ncbi:MAG: hypothetical protein JO057_09670, partial [Chloroflexi bacterium]|nr:hypothetical protein [Chloroflexota bacterium]
ATLVGTYTYNQGTSTWSYAGSLQASGLEWNNGNSQPNLDLDASLVSMNGSVN